MCPIPSTHECAVGHTVAITADWLPRQNASAFSTPLPAAIARQWQGANEAPAGPSGQTRLLQSRDEGRRAAAAVEGGLRAAGEGGLKAGVGVQQQIRSEISCAPVRWLRIKINPQIETTLLFDHSVHHTVVHSQTHSAAQQDKGPSTLTARTQ